MLCEKLAELFCIFGKEEAITLSSDSVIIVFRSGVVVLLIVTIFT